jgi:hypothetical protein
VTGQRLLFSSALDFMPKPRSRRTDPETSRDAGRRATTRTRDHSRLILAVLGESSVALNCYQIATRTDGRGMAALSQVQVARRMAGLLELALIIVDGTSDRGRCFRLRLARDAKETPK